MILDFDKCGMQIFLRIVIHEDLKELVWNTHQQLS